MKLQKNSARILLIAMLAAFSQSCKKSEGGGGSTQTVPSDPVTRPACLYSTVQTTTVFQQCILYKSDYPGATQSSIDTACASVNGAAEATCPCDSTYIGRCTAMTHPSMDAVAEHWFYDYPTDGYVDDESFGTGMCTSSAGVFDPTNGPVGCQ